MFWKASPSQLIPLFVSSARAECWFRDWRSLTRDSAFFLLSLSYFLVRSQPMRIPSGECLSPSTPLKARTDVRNNCPTMKPLPRWRYTTRDPMRSFGGQTCGHGKDAAPHNPGNKPAWPSVGQDRTLEDVCGGPSVPYRREAFLDLYQGAFCVFCGPILPIREGIWSDFFVD